MTTIEAIEKLTVGSIVIADLGAKRSVKCYVGEKRENAIYLWQNEIDGSCGGIAPSSKGFKHSWVVIKESTDTSNIRMPNWDE